MAYLEIQGTRILARTIDASKTHKLIIHEGGSRSSKTWSIIQFFLLKALEGEKFVLTIARSNLTWVKATILKDFQEITCKYNIPVSPDINTNRPEQTYNVLGSEFAFFGLDYPQKLHGRTQDYFWINEAMEIGRKEFDQLEMRTKIAGIIDYNPSDDSHWVYDLEKRPDVIVIRSTMIDNPFLPDTIINKIKSYEPTPQNITAGTADQYMWEVYGKGNRARLQGTIFNNWDIVEDVPKDANFVAYGLDFGYTNDPTAMIAIYLFNNELYVEELLFNTALTNSDIAEEFKALNVKNSDIIWADSSEPKSIEEIRRHGYNIKGVTKGQDSVNYGIDLIKEYKMHITRKSINLENELRKYKWMEDKSGKVLNKPVDAYNHAIDSLRYCVMESLKKKQAFKFVSNY
tara:strand:+ start:1153 stop:2358 length:1206 start_codon:yes stop_codon:yes gene_type:complete